MLAHDGLVLTKAWENFCRGFFRTGQVLSSIFEVRSSLVTYDVKSSDGSEMKVDIIMAKTHEGCISWRAFVQPLVYLAGSSLLIDADGRRSQPLTIDLFLKNVAECLTEKISYGSA